MYASMIKWKKAQRKAGNGTHWTMRRSLRRSVSKVVGAPNSAASDGAMQKSATKTRSSTKTKSIRASAKEHEEVKAGEEGEVVVNKVKVGGLDALEAIHTESGARLKFSLFGGQLLSYRAADGKEKLFLSRQAKMDGKKAIRGGMPVVFPQFGSDGPLPSHGFARTSKWEMEGEPHLEHGMVTIRLVLRHNKETGKLWKHKFDLVQLVRFGKNELEASLTVTNTGKKAFEFQGLLHTYLRVRDVTQASLEGLDGLRVVDKLQYYLPEDGRQVYVETAKKLSVQCEIDNVYMEAGSDRPVVLTSRADNSRVEINMALCHGDDLVPCDVVVWNPWAAKSKRLADMGDAEYSGMICVEPGCASRKEQCGPGESWTVTQNLKFSKLSKYGVRD